MEITANGTGRTRAYTALRAASEAVRELGPAVTSRYQSECRECELLRCSSRLRWKREVGRCAGRRVAVQRPPGYRPAAAGPPVSTPRQHLPPRHPRMAPPDHASPPAVSD